MESNEIFGVGLLESTDKSSTQKLIYDFARSTIEKERRRQKKITEGKPDKINLFLYPGSGQVAENLEALLLNNPLTNMHIASLTLFVDEASTKTLLSDRGDSISGSAQTPNYQDSFMNVVQFRKLEDLNLNNRLITHPKGDKNNPYANMIIFTPHYDFFSYSIGKEGVSKEVYQLETISFNREQELLSIIDKLNGLTSLSLNQRDEKLRCNIELSTIYTVRRRLVSTFMDVADNYYNLINNPEAQITALEDYFKKFKDRITRFKSKINEVLTNPEYNIVYDQNNKTKGLIELGRWNNSAENILSAFEFGRFLRKINYQGLVTVFTNPADVVAYALLLGSNLPSEHVCASGSNQYGRTKVFLERKVSELFPEMRCIPVHEGNHEPAAVLFENETVITYKQKEFTLGKLLADKMLQKELQIFNLGIKFIFEACKNADANAQEYPAREMKRYGTTGRDTSSWYVNTDLVQFLEDSDGEPVFRCWYDPKIKAFTGKLVKTDKFGRIDTESAHSRKHSSPNEEKKVEEIKKLTIKLSRTIDEFLSMEGLLTEVFLQPIAERKNIDLPNIYSAPQQLPFPIEFWGVRADYAFYRRIETDGSLTAENKGIWISVNYNVLGVAIRNLVFLNEMVDRSEISRLYICSCSPEKSEFDRLFYENKFEFKNAWISNDYVLTLVKKSETEYSLCVRNMLDKIIIRTKTFREEQNADLENTLKEYGILDREVIERPEYALYEKLKSAKKITAERVNCAVFNKENFIAIIESNDSSAKSYELIFGTQSENSVVIQGIKAIELNYESIHLVR